MASDKDQVTNSNLVGPIEIGFAKCGRPASNRGALPKRPIRSSGFPTNRRILAMLNASKLGGSWRAMPDAYRMLYLIANL